MNWAIEGALAKDSRTSWPRRSEETTLLRFSTWRWTWWTMSKIAAASDAGTNSPALRSNRRRPSVSSVCLTRREMPGADTFSSRAAPWIVPVIITARITSMTLNNPNDPVTIVNNQYNADGSLNQTRVKPQNAGFGAVSGYQAARTVQGYIRFKF